MNRIGLAVVSAFGPRSFAGDRLSTTSHSLTGTKLESGHVTQGDADRYGRSCQGPRNCRDMFATTWRATLGIERHSTRTMRIYRAARPHLGPLHGELSPTGARLKRSSLGVRMRADDIRFEVLLTRRRPSLSGACAAVRRHFRATRLQPHIHFRLRLADQGNVVGVFVSGHRSSIAAHRGQCSSILANVQ